MESCRVACRLLGVGVQGSMQQGSRRCEERVTLFDAILSDHVMDVTSVTTLPPAT
jgi:hypothetical protein